MVIATTNVIFKYRVLEYDKNKTEEFEKLRIKSDINNLKQRENT